MKALVKIEESPQVAAVRKRLLKRHRKYESGKSLRPPLIHEQVTIEGLTFLLTLRLDQADNVVLQVVPFLPAKPTDFKKLEVAK